MQPARARKPSRISPEARRKWTACVCAIVVIVLAMWMSAAMRGYPEADGLLHGALRSPVLALELAHDERELASVLGRGHRDEARIAQIFRDATSIDQFFIPAYVALLAAFLAIVFENGEGVWKWIRRFAVGLALAAGAADYVENRGIFEAIDAPMLDLERALAIYRPAVVKWCLLLGVCAIAALGLLVRGARTALGPVAARLAGLVMLVGLGLAGRAPEQLAFLERAVTLLAGAVLPACLIAPVIRESPSHTRRQ
ncbi:MAG: hypothetical protein U0Q16_33160 [Bryobacteraceae bacterium]